MNKINCVISCPISTYSGYGARSRDFVKSLLKIKGEEWDIKVLPQRWGNTRMGFLEDESEQDLINILINRIEYQPDIWIQISVPNEFQKIGKHYNIGVTAGIETDACDVSWIEGCNRMDLILTSSEHSKYVFNRSTFEQRNKSDNSLLKKIELTTKVEVLHESLDITKYFKYTPPTTEFVKDIFKIKEKFCFLFVGTWLQGEFGQDRKNIGYLIKSFLEVFKNKTNPPALILKTQGATSSFRDEMDIINKIQSIEKSVNSNRLPKIYLFHGDVTDKEMNDLYNHPKVKCMVSFTKGEGFGRPLLEFSTTEKPIICTNWSGHIDFLKKEYSLLVGGELEKIHHSAVVPNMLIPESNWFKPNDGEVGYAWLEIFNNYNKYKKLAIQQAKFTINNFKEENINHKLENILKENIPEIPKFIPFNLPKDISLPKLKKVE